MKKRIFIIAFLFTACIAALTIAPNYIKSTAKLQSSSLEVNKLIRANWASSGNWFYLYDPQISDYEKSLVTEVEFPQSPSAEYLNNLEKYVSIINDKYNEKIKVKGYKKDKNHIEIKYEDGPSLVFYFDKGEIMYGFVD